MFRYLLLLLCLSVMSVSCYEPLGDVACTGDVIEGGALKGVCQQTSRYQTCLSREGVVTVSTLGSDRAYESDEVSCDGLDNDCDGAVDEGLDAPLSTLKEGGGGGQVKVCGGREGWLEPDYSQEAPSFYSITGFIIRRPSRLR